ncbi:hypothetical protein PQR66_09385 [Paraburkholderia agricolaris]|jgi:hypothetical protein|uniref:Uncharacterized protein n=1 Tax=Paraburkholderia agricolaris TaxID=2152888 RepID=A0ABW8ZJ40_9BURK
MTINQQRISLKNLKVADFASEETLCFTATVLFDGKPIAQTRNGGHGGGTDLHPLRSTQARLAEAEALAQSLPPFVTSHGGPDQSSENFTIEMSLDFLIDLLVSDMHFERKMRASFKRDFGNKAMFVRDGGLRFLKGNVLEKYADKTILFAQMRKTFGDSIVILNELPMEEAFSLWKRHMDVDDTD